MKYALTLLTALLLTPLAALPAAEVAQGKAKLPEFKLQTADNKWPEPAIVESKYDGTLVPPPLGAIVLFDGQNASGWVAIPNKNDTNQSSQFIWKVENGYMEVVTPPGAREQRLAGTKESPITSGHLHIEWATPAQVKGTGQGRGNSGVFIEGFPELQVLDSFNNPTYFDGQAAAFYKNRPPLVSACRGPGLWQCYDIYLHRAKVADGKIVQPSVITVYHNHVLVQDHVAFPSSIQASTLRLQDHLNPVRFRNIWFMPGETVSQP